MRALPLTDITEEMRLGKTLYKGDGRVLLARGTRLSGSYLDSLKAQGFSALYVEDPNLPELPEDAVSEKTRLKAALALKEALGDLKQGGGRNLHEDWAGRRLLRAAGDAILNELSAQKHLLFQVLELRAADDGYLFAHSVQVCVLGLALAKYAQIPHKRLPDLAMALLLHDVGVALLPEELRGPELDWGSPEGEGYMAHAGHGHALLKGMSDTYGAVCRAVALQHHEHWDGSGLPQGLKGNLIHPFAQVCAVADTYDRLTTSRAFGGVAPPHEALEFMMACGGTRFPLPLVQGILKLVAPFPLGTTVRLSDGRLGVVIGVPHHLPSRPTLRLPGGEDLDLLEHQALTVTGVAGGPARPQASGQP